MLNRVSTAVKILDKRESGGGGGPWGYWQMLNNGYLRWFFFNLTWDPIFFFFCCNLFNQFSKPYHPSWVWRTERFARFWQLVTKILFSKSASHYPSFFSPNSRRSRRMPSAASRSCSSWNLRTDSPLRSVWNILGLQSKFSQFFFHFFKYIGGIIH